MLSACALLTLVAAGGCASLNYERIALGMGPAELSRVLPEARTRPTPVGLAYLDPGDATGGRPGAAIVVLLTEQRRVAGKFLAERTADALWAGRPAYRLIGEVDAELYGVQQTSPIDVARMIAGELAQVEGERLVREAHGWVAAGLLRWLEGWPGLRDFAVPEDARDRLLELAPAGGTLALERTGGGRLRFAYASD